MNELLYQNSPPHSVLSLLAWLYIQLVGKTSRINIREVNRYTGPAVYALWHRQEVLFIYLHRNQNVCGLVSKSKDGEYMARILKRFGFSFVRGSTSSGSLMALRGLIKAVRDGYSAAITPDGPKGPIFKAQPGIVYLAQKAGVPVETVSELFIYGNHSPTMFADFTHAKIGGRAAAEVIGDEAWLKNEFLPTVGKRGGAIVEARGVSSAASAANAVIDYVRDLNTPGSISAVAVASHGRYGFSDGIWAGMPVRATATGYEPGTTYEMDDFAKSKIAITNDELVGERDTVKHMLG